MRKDLKRQIKEDELVTGFERVMGYVDANRTAVQYGAIAAAVLVAGGWAFVAWNQRRTERAEAAFMEALKTFEAPLRSEIPKDAQLPAGLQVFDSAADKYKKAAAGFDGVERGFAGHPVALRARYFAALARAESGDGAGAQKQLEAVAAQSGTLEAALAKLALAGLLRKTDPAKAVEAYSKLANDPSWPLPKDHALMELAATQERASQAKDARATYKRLADDFPDSVYASEARRRAEDLGSAG